MQSRKLLMISTDRKIFEEGSAVRARQAEYAKEWEEVHIIIFDKVKRSKLKVQSESQNPKLVPSSEQGSETVIAPNCWAYSTKSWTKFMYPFDAINLGRFIIGKRGITNITCQDASLTAMAGISLKKQFQKNKPDAPIFLEVQVHEDIGSPNFGYNLSNRIRKTLALSYLPKADQIRVVSNRIKDYLIGTLGIETSKIFVKPIAIDVEKIQSAPIIAGADLHKKYSQFEKIVLMASRLEKEKNVELAIRAWARVIEKMPKVGLVIVGSGSQISYLKSLTSRLFARGSGSDVDRDNIGKNSQPNKDIPISVIFEPWADHQTLISYYKTADLFLNTSLFEGYGMTLVEAKAAGCKVFSTDVGVAREVGAEIAGWGGREVAESVVKELKSI